MSSAPAPAIPSSTEQSWLQAAYDSIVEVCGTVLCGARIERLGPPEPDSSRHGAFVALAGEGGTSAQVGVLGAASDCAVVARLMFGLKESQQPSDADVSDGMGEIANMVAGGLKRRLGGRYGSLLLGLPLFVRGPVDASRSGFHRAELAVRVDKGTLVLSLIWCEP
jgi:hypothetical protein